ncbi:MAG: DDE-type integrase/transposase/recombinase, partial [Aeromonas sp.]
MELAHTHPMAGHMAAANTIQRIRDRFHWPGLEGEVKRFCQSCPICQQTSPQRPPPSPLIPLPVIEVPFERIGMDLVGPLPKSARGHEYILVVVDYATRYPEAIPLRKATSKAIAKELFLLYSRVGIPTEVLTDQGTPFMSRLIAELCRLLKVKQLRTSVYHPQTDGLVERFNQTLKRMLRRVVAEDGRDWDLLLPYVLFGVREVPQASTAALSTRGSSAGYRGGNQQDENAWSDRALPQPMVQSHRDGPKTRRHSPLLQRFPEA